MRKRILVTTHTILTEITITLSVLAVAEQSKSNLGADIDMELILLGKALADVLDHYDAFVSYPFGKWEIVGNGFLINGGGYSFDAHTLRNLHILQKKNDRITERVKSVGPIEEAKGIINEENSKIENFVRHGE